MSILSGFVSATGTAFFGLSAGITALVIVCICAVTLAAAFALCKKLFLDKDYSKKQKHTLLALVMSIAAVVLFAAIFSPFLYRMMDYEKVKQRTKFLIIFIVAMLLIAAALFAAVRGIAKPKENLYTTKEITRLAVFTALSVVLYQFVKFPLPFLFPEFLDIQFSDMPALLAGFMMGPLAGSIVIILKVLIKLPFTGTGGVGELGDLILGLTFMLTSVLIYRRLRTKKGAIIALCCGSVACIAAALVVNRFVLIPFYTNFMLPWPALLGMVSKLYPNVTQASFYRYYLWLAVLPFNALRCIIVVAVTFFMYKPTCRIFGFVEGKIKKALSEAAQKNPNKAASTSAADCPADGLADSATGGKSECSTNDKSECPADEGKG